MDCLKICTFIHLILSLFTGRFLKASLLNKKEKQIYVYSVYRAGGLWNQDPPARKTDTLMPAVKALANTETNVLLLTIIFLNKSLNFNSLLYIIAIIKALIIRYNKLLNIILIEVCHLIWQPLQHGCFDRIVFAVVLTT